MALLVQKYGGTSLQTPERILNVAKRIAKVVNGGNSLVVAVSAMGHTTDELIDLAKKVSTNPPQREMDMLLSTGEQVSAALLAMALSDLGYRSVSLTGAQAGIYTEQVFSKARIMDVKADRLKKELGEGKIVIVTGFQGITQDDEITTLGRGGSDTTAVALAIALNAQQCEIYTDVDGVYTTDPRIVKEARKLHSITYDEMLEMASLGAQVLHPRSVELAKMYNMKLLVKSSMQEIEGTEVIGDINMELAQPVSGVTLDTNQAKVAILKVADKPGVASQIFGTLAKNNISVDMIIQSIHGDVTNDMAFTVQKDELEKCVEILKSLKMGDVIFDDNIAKVSIVGAGMIGRPGIAAKMFESLAAANINIQMIATSEIKVSCIISKEYAREAVKVIHQAFELEKI